MPSAHGNAEAVEQRTHIEMMDVADKETHHGILLRSLTDEPHPLDGAQLLHAIMGKVALMGCYAVETDALDIVDGNRQSMGGDIVGRACLKLQRRTLKSGALKTHRGNHLSPTLIGRQTVEPLLPAIKHTDARRTIHLMTAECEEVAAECLHVDLEVGRALRGVDEHRHAMLMSDADDVGDRIDGAQHIAHMSNADETSAVGEQLLILVHEELAAVADRDDTEADALACLQQLPRHDIGMVLHHRHDDLVALLHEFAHAACHQIDGFGGATGKNNLLCLRCIDEAANGLAGCLMEVGGLLREIVDATVHVGIDVEVFLAHGIKHAQRLLRRGGIVEIHQRPVVDRA